MTLVTLYGGILNAINRFAAAAAAPILLNLAMIATLASAALFPTAGHAAAWGVLIAGFLELLLVGGDAWRVGVLAKPAWPTWGEDLKRFFKALVPATIGSAGLQIALFADTLFATLFAAGALSALYYADRLNQLPIGVIGIAVGTVLLPEMANRIAAGDEVGARRAQNGAIELTLLLSIPCLVAFLIVPDLIMRALFMRGAFTAADASAAGHTLAAYALGLLPFVLIRSVTATFLARGDTATPVKAALTAVAVNVAFKGLFYATTDLNQVGLALATSIGAWVNFMLVAYFAWRARLIVSEPSLTRSATQLALAGLALAVVLLVAQRPFNALSSDWRSLRDETMLAALAGLGMVVYGGALVALFGLGRLRAFAKRSSSADLAGCRRHRCGRSRCRHQFGGARRGKLQGPGRVDQAGAELVVGAELLGAGHEDAANVGRRQLRIALEHQGDDAADMGGRNRGAGGHLIGALRGRHQDVDARRCDRDVASAIGAGEQLVVHVGRRHRDHVRVRGRVERRRLRAGVAGRRDHHDAPVVGRLDRSLE